MRPYCGIDFGTSNSGVCVGLGDQLRLVPIEGEATTLPSAIFFNTETGRTQFGRVAMSEYLEGYEGRLMRALKSVLGTTLFKETTQIGAGRKSFHTIIGLYIAHLKQTAEAFAGHKIEDVVLGRPVHFVDDNPEADQQAENELRAIAEAQGFRNIRFEYEPLAAARDFQSRLEGAATILVVDIGGGTSDFSVMRLTSVKADILANVGVHIGGTNFDKALSLATAMPDMGFRSLMSNGNDMPGLYYHQLSTWHLINQLYTQKTLLGAKELHYLAQRRNLVGRLLKVLEGRYGHDIAARIEAAKITLSSEDTAHLDYSHIEKGWTSDIDRTGLIEATTRDVSKIILTAEQALSKAGLMPHEVDTLFLTGGSTALPGFETALKAAFPSASLNYGDRFASVVQGLGLAAQAEFAA
ncbi:Hsp70 family protein [Asticcacaulis tiandongensis]|uniref:Hsp70 family protein n=1 Tax=Asticcacaulis tiandongensis TaxID=2565365 RepID=UPI00112CC08A|nr:Hsp70 family protein [Asticcacaulis tiandongensis]